MSLLETARRLQRVGLTPGRLGREEWRATVGAQHRLSQGSSKTPAGRPIRWFTSENLRAMQERNRAVATPAQLERAREQRDQAVPETCELCAGGRFVLTRLSPTSTPVPVPCDCMPLEERAALAGVPPRFRGAVVEGEPHRGQLVLSGPVGTGKTHHACGLVMRELEAGRPARFVYAPDFLEEVKARFDAKDGEQAQAYVDRIASEPFLLLDDLGAEQATEWAGVTLRSLIDRRYRSELPTLITTNLASTREVSERYGGAVASRLSEWTWWRFDGPDLRQRKAKGVA